MYNIDSSVKTLDLLGAAMLSPMMFMQTTGAAWTPLVKPKLPDGSDLSDDTDEVFQSLSLYVWPKVTARLSLCPSMITSKFRKECQLIQQFDVVHH